MERFKLFLLLIIMTTSLLTAQNSGLNIEVQKIAGSSNWKMDLQLNLDQNAGQGIVVDLPDGIHAVPVSIKIDNNDYWLKESTDTVNNETVVNWERSDSTLVLRFKADTLPQTGTLNLECMAQVDKNAQANPSFAVKRLVNNNSADAVTIATTNVTIAQ